MIYQSHNQFWKLFWDLYCSHLTLKESSFGFQVFEVNLLKAWCIEIHSRWGDAKNWFPNWVERKFDLLGPDPVNHVPTYSFID